MKLPSILAFAHPGIKRRSRKRSIQALAFATGMPRPRSASAAKRRQRTPMSPLMIIFSLAVGLSSAFSHSALHYRGGGMIYDDVLDVTWLEDARYAVTQGVPCSLCTTDVPRRAGQLSWEDATNWVENLVYEGFDDWRLPSLYSPPPFDSHNDWNSELRHMFFTNLTHQSQYIDGTTGETRTIKNHGQGLDYWFAESRDHATRPNWYFETLSLQSAPEGFTHATDGSTVGLYAWAVRDGDVTAIPVPATAWLFGTALLGMTTVRHRKSA